MKCESAEELMDTDLGKDYCEVCVWKQRKEREGRKATARKSVEEGWQQQVCRPAPPGMLALRHVLTIPPTRSLSQPVHQLKVTLDVSKIESA